MGQKKTKKSTTSKKSSSKSVKKGVEKKEVKKDKKSGSDHKCKCVKDCSGETIKRTVFVSTDPPEKVLNEITNEDSGSRLFQDGDFNFLKKKLADKDADVRGIVDFYKRELRDKDQMIKMLNEEILLLRRKAVFLEARSTRGDEEIEKAVLNKASLP